MSAHYYPEEVLAYSKKIVFLSEDLDLNRAIKAAHPPLKSNNSLDAKNQQYTYDDKGRVSAIARYRETGELHFYMNVKKGEIHGKAFTYYKNGNIYCDLIYLENKMHGLCKGYYSTTQLAIEVLFDRGMALMGVYYKKNGFKKIMTLSQLDKKTKKAL